jgi:hypothetical protein
MYLGSKKIIAKYKSPIETAEYTFTVLLTTWDKNVYTFDCAGKLLKENSYCCQGIFMQTVERKHIVLLLK